MKQNMGSVLLTSFLYLCGYLLFLEWLYPMGMFSDQFPIYVMVLYASYCFLISLLNIRWWISMPLKAIGLFYIMDQLFLQAPLFSQGSLQLFIEEISYNLGLVMQYEWFGLTLMFRMLMVLLFIWLMSYLIYYWFVTMRRVFLLVFLTFIYITVLDTFTMYDSTYSIIRTFIFAFLAFGILNFLRAYEQCSYPKLSFTKVFAWGSPVIILILLSAAFGYAAPKYDAQWPDPVPYLIHYTKNDNSDRGREPGLSGYREDDSTLGGSFIRDDTVVFRVATTKRNYWRIETKDIYTGKGWKDSPDKSWLPMDGNTIPLHVFHDHVPTEYLSAMIEFEQNVNLHRLVYPNEIINLVLKDQEDLHFDSFTDAIEKTSEESFAGDVIELNYGRPIYDESILRNADEDDPMEIRDRYLQIPESLPERVVDLAKEITAEDNNRYDQAKSIEQYFGENDFIYQTGDIPYPKANQDYVDQFLFDTKRGYCDNYSTSMVMMLRALDIPARWVKGFTSGQKLGQMIEHEQEGPFDVYEITNENAHSWVEVYFPWIGWVPFEPTQGFDNLLDVHTESSHAEGAEDLVDRESAESDVDHEEAPSLSEEVEETRATPIKEQAKDNHLLLWLLALCLGLLVFVGWFVYDQRDHLKIAYLRRKFTREKETKTFMRAYHQLLQLLQKRGLERPPYQTLREYALTVDDHYETDKMGELTTVYEKYLYDKQQEPTEEQMKLWDELIQQIFSKKN